jgi:hypothetical protein
MGYGYVQQCMYQHSNPYWLTTQTPVVELFESLVYTPASGFRASGFELLTPVSLFQTPSSVFITPASRF